MTVQSTLISLSGQSGATWLGAAAYTGHRVFVVVVDRGGGVTCTITTDDPAWPSGAFVQVGERVTLPDDTNNRRSVFLFESVVPTGINNPVIASDVRNAANVTQANSFMLMATDDFGDYQLAGVSSNDTGVATATSVLLGAVADVLEGDHLIVSGGVSRGESESATSRFQITSSIPPNPAGGTWNLASLSGTGANARFGAAGYASLARQAEQSYEDTFFVTPNARTLSGVTAVWRRAPVEGIVQQKGGVYHPTDNNVNVSLPLATTPGNTVVVFFCGNSIITPPGGLTQRMAEVNLMGQYLYDVAADGSNSWAFTQGSGGGMWWAAEIEGAFDTANGSNGAPTGNDYTVDPILPTTGRQLILANMGAISGVTDLVLEVDAWTAGLVELVDIGVNEQDSPMGAVGYLIVDADGIAEYSTTATYSAAPFSGTGIIAAYKLFAAPEPTLPVVSETDSAIELTGSKTAALTAPVETDTSQELPGSKSSDLPPTSEADTVQLLVGAKTAVLPVVIETDIARELASDVSAPLPVAQESDTSVPLVGTKTAVLPVVIETDTATELSGAKSAVLFVATEADLARVLTGAKQGSLTPAVETDTARILTPETGEIRIFFGDGTPSRAYRLEGEVLVEVTPEFIP